MTAQAPLRPLRLPVLLDQQFWFLGHDIRHEAGNALERFGFTRWRHAHGVGTSCYVLHLGPASALVCWGFAAYLGTVTGPTTAPETAAADRALATDARRHAAPAGILVQRHSMTPRLVLSPPHLPVHRLADLPRIRTPQSRTDWTTVHEGLHTLATLFARYELWAQRALGEPYRLDTLRALPRHKRRKFELVADLSAHWSRWLH
jgi:hypothetical protein